MISVIIPLMPVEPYKTQVKACIASIKGQVCWEETEIIVSEQVPERYISKNALLNSGIAKAKGKYIFLCDADFILNDKYLLLKMQDKLRKGFDVIFPMFMSEKYKKLKIADGGVFACSELFDKFGELDESLEGISWVTFPFLKWCMDNARWHCSDEFVIGVDQGHRSRKKRHNGTSAKMRPIYKKVVGLLQKEGVWP